MDFKMTDDRLVSIQVREFQLIANNIRAACMVLDENFHVGAIVAKLPSTWKEYHNKLKHEKQDLALDQLMQHLHIDEETRNRENEHAKETIVKAHVVVYKDEKKNSGRHNQNKFLKPKNSKGFKPSSSNPNAKNKECYNCHKISHLAKDCYQLKYESDKKKADLESFTPVYVDIFVFDHFMVVCAHILAMYIFLSMSFRPLRFMPNIEIVMKLFGK
ncbi:hypothetical protein RJ639_043718 [Escallonia herrerae]|uniref:CCHC-type domain-containing protein n=1 Tax=Escallonia herrerae TaxID=1293975 RepID=A0AA89B8Z9_9ASTE|nr:hypothetical protein RJ639_043718 [Escallonia herrerae]